MKFYVSLIILGLAFFQGFSQYQSSQLDSASLAIEKSDYNKARLLLKSMDTTALSQSELGKYFNTKGIFYYDTDEHDEAYKNFLKAKAYFLAIDDNKQVVDINFYLIATANYLEVNNKYINGFIEEICSYALDKNDKELQCDCFYSKLSQLDPTEATYVKDALPLMWKYKSIALENKLSSNLEIAYFNLGSIHSEVPNKDSTLFYYDKLNKIALNNNDLKTISYLNNNYAVLYRNLKDYDKSIEYHLKSINGELSKEEPSSKLFYLKNLAKTYSLKGDSKNAANTYEKVLLINDSLNRNEQSIAVNELETKYQTTKKEKENLKLKAATEAQRAKIYALSGSAVILALAGVFLYHNQRKKKIIAQKEQELEKQRANTILKNQELATIDAMITGQEKERKRLAEELHDNLGSSLTTIKLYFENLKSFVKEEQSLEVYERTEQILENTYETVRSMSHTRNNGVLASKGLIPSIESLCKKITESGQIKVQVFHYGLDKKLESSIELIIFRTVQELLSNVIKHAHATEVVLNLTSYDNNLNIIVEDNGNGFDPKSLITNTGMGLNNIEKRIESIEGTFEIDSSTKRGTTINIDIPYYDKTSYS